MSPSYVFFEQVHSRTGPKFRRLLLMVKPGKSERTFRFLHGAHWDVRLLSVKTRSSRRPVRNYRDKVSTLVILVSLLHAKGTQRVGQSSSRLRHRTQVTDTRSYERNRNGDWVSMGRSPPSREGSRRPTPSRSTYIETSPTVCSDYYTITLCYPRHRPFRGEGQKGPLRSFFETHTLLRWTLRGPPRETLGDTSDFLTLTEDFDHKTSLSPA